MVKEQLIQFIDEAEKIALVGKQKEIWGTGVSQAEIFDDGVREMTYRLKTLLDVLATNSNK